MTRCAVAMAQALDRVKDLGTTSGLGRKGIQGTFAMPYGVERTRWEQVHESGFDASDGIREWVPRPTPHLEGT